MSSKANNSKAEILLESKEQKISYFEKFTASHPKLIQVMKKLKNEIYSQSNSDILMVVGPSGVGKSKLFERTLISILKDFSSEMEVDKGMIPIAGMELPNPDLGKFSWKDFYYRVLLQLTEPLIDDKIDIEAMLRNKQGSLDGKKAGTAPELRRSVEKAFDNRKTKAFLIDEAQHFFNIGSRSISTKQFNSIKSLANMANTKIVLFGTYQLNEVINLDGQLSRRVKELHFPKYDYSNPDEVKMFKSILFSFQRNLPVEEQPDLIQYHEYIYEHCVGCTGILKRWLQRCLSDALESGHKTITFENLKRNALQNKKLLTLAHEAINGEGEFLDNDNDIDELKRLLKTNKRQEKPSKASVNKTPGKRDPGRDKVGAS
ncbi:AAA family ATPase [Aquibacillus halophilus]|uniref:AAA family ATPase n=1 Tax=Aquibacillus halophilus TaxID=930132 RepID=A0A6A8DE21_9BACI|nr:TniB family NTP-binding protein [Aquibacillus halophilus]MRH42089.1 AAA family ATPase [Aquibacillus halophilus]